MMKHFTSNQIGVVYLSTELRTTVVYNHSASGWFCDITTHINTHAHTHTYYDSITALPTSELKLMIIRKDFTALQITISQTLRTLQNVSFTCVTSESASVHCYVSQPMYSRAIFERPDPFLLSVHRGIQLMDCRSELFQYSTFSDCLRYRKHQ